MKIEIYDRDDVKGLLREFLNFHLSFTAIDLTLRCWDWRLTMVKGAAHYWTSRCMWTAGRHWMSTGLHFTLHIEQIFHSFSIYFRARSTAPFSWLSSCLKCKWTANQCPQTLNSFHIRALVSFAWMPPWTLSQLGREWIFRGATRSTREANKISISDFSNRIEIGSEREENRIIKFILKKYVKCSECAVHTYT